MNSVSKSLAILSLGMVVMGSFACRAAPSSRTKNVAPLAIPSSQQLRIATARLVESSPEIESFMIELSSPVQNGLSTSFDLKNQTTSSQILGWVAANEVDSFTLQARFKNGQQSGCESAAAGGGAFGFLKSAQRSFNCNGHRVGLQLTRDPSDADRMSRFTSEKALIQGASLLLTDTSNSENVLEFTLRGDKAFLSQKSKSQSANAQMTFSPQEIKSFLEAEAPLNFHCTASPCSETLDSMSILLKKNGELLARKEQRTSGSTQSFFAGQVYRRAASESLRVATYNVENFWDDVADNSKPYDDFSSEYSDWYTGQFADKKAQRIREALLAAGLPDVVGLQEIESADNKSRSLELLKPYLTPLGYHYYALGQQAEDNTTAVTTAFVSKFPILENVRLDFRFDSKELTDDNRDDFVAASRDPQRITIGLPESVTMTFLNSHWKSKRDKSPLGDTMRAAIGRLMRQHLDDLKRLNGQPIAAVIMGDFNSDYREQPVQDGLQLAATLAAARASDKSLFDLWQTRRMEEQGDYPHDSDMTAIDNLVLTQPLLSTHSIVLSSPLRVVGDFGIAAQTLRNGDLLPFRSQRFQIKGDDGKLKTFHRNMGYSDHLPLVAEFTRSLSASRLVQAPRFSADIEQQVASAVKATVPNAACTESEVRRVAPSELSQVLNSAERGSCFYVEGPFKLRKTGLFNIAFDLDSSVSASASERIVIISADRGFGANKDWLRNTLQRSEGRTLTRIRARLGIIDGVKALFVSDPSSDLAME